jgi:anthranilate phosphoribosyltransferase
LAGGAPAENARITREILQGEPGPKRDAVLLNSAAAIHIADPNIPMERAIETARRTIDGGKALTQLERFIELSQA